MSPSTKLSISLKKINLSIVKTMTTGDACVSSIDSRNPYNRVTIRAKVLRVQLPINVSPRLKKQDITVADATAAVKVMLWEANENTVKEEALYEFRNFSV